MNDVAELKHFAEIHARAQGISRRVSGSVIARVRHDDSDIGPGSWTTEWSRVAEDLERSGNLLDAVSCYAMARFPYAADSARQQASQRCVSAFDRWRRDGTGIDRLELDVDGGTVRCWTKGLSKAERRPVLLIMGGIVTVKEQWSALLTGMHWLGMAGVVTEMPGVGENTLRYDAESWRMIPAILDAIADRADVTRAYAINLSFSGHLALRAAGHDDRIRGIITAGTPIREFFTDAAWQGGLPRVTVDTLAHLTATDRASLGACIWDWALTDKDLAAVRIPVSTIVSSQDEVVPAADVRLLREQIPALSLVEFDDVHGSPDHLLESRVWTGLSLLRMIRMREAKRAAFELMWQATKLRHLLSRG